jgi:hypothetical protein
VGRCTSSWTAGLRTLSARLLRVARKSSSTVAQNQCAVSWAPKQKIHTPARQAPAALRAASGCSRKASAAAKISDSRRFCTPAVRSLALPRPSAGTGTNQTHHKQGPSKNEAHTCSTSSCCVAGSYRLFVRASAAAEGSDSLVPYAGNASSTAATGT